MKCNQFYHPQGEKCASSYELIDVLDALCSPPNYLSLFYGFSIKFERFIEWNEGNCIPFTHEARFTNAIGAPTSSVVQILHNKV